MKLICPSCGAVHSAEGWVSGADARQCMAVIARMPLEVSKQALPYIALFRPRVPESEKNYRGLIWSRALRLLKELEDLLADAHIGWQGRPARPNSQRAWAMAMEQVIQRPPRRLPLSSHGYLRRIAYDIADEMDRKEEVRHNQAERSGRVRKTRSAENKDPERFSMGVEEMRRIRMKNMGGKRKH